MQMLVVPDLTLRVRGGGSTPLTVTWVRPEIEIEPGISEVVAIMQVHNPGSTTPVLVGYTWETSHAMVTDVEIETPVEIVAGGTTEIPVTLTISGAEAGDIAIVSIEDAP